MFHSPWYLTLLVLVAGLAWLGFRSMPATGVRFSSIRHALELPPTLRQRLMWLPTALGLGSLTIAILCLAEPREGRDQTVTSSEGIALQIVCDRSGSMQAMDFKIDGQNVDRLTAIKNVVTKFVLGDGSKLTGRVSDLVGLISFARFADGLIPLTLDHAYLVTELKKTEIVSEQNEDGTAIGDGLALAVEKLNALDARQAKKVKSKVIVLLTDGENNVGETDPMQAAELAAKMGIKVYAIGVGTKGRAPIPVTDPFTGRRVLQWMQVNIDEETLQKVADSTGGKYFRATDTESLEKIYSEIDQLEKTQVESKRFTNYRELAVQSHRLAGLPMPAWLWISFILLALKVILENTWLSELT